MESPKRTSNWRPHSLVFCRLAVDPAGFGDGLRSIHSAFAAVTCGVAQLGFNTLCVCVVFGAMQLFGDCRQRALHGFQRKPVSVRV